ncbi:alpha/beta fold hydrolase [Aeromicrobium sp. UC242_57]|uniref:alpha/beta fold hydrolase n=1 Tax=Aeromicrobium sp. UC242_57 TaxID=3374624 RepID=UPI0037B3FA83
MGPHRASDLADLPDRGFDYRGTGETRSELGPWSTASFARDAAHVLDELEIPTAHVYGTSMGGRVAQMLAIEHPHLVDRLVLACTSPGGELAVERSQDVRRRLADPDRQARHRALVDLFYTPAWASTHERSTLFGDSSMSAKAQQLHLRVSAQHDASHRLGNIVAPTLVLHGSDDEMAPVENATAIAARISDCSVEITPGGRHGFFDEFSSTVTPHVVAFLSA